MAGAGHLRLPPMTPKRATPAERHLRHCARASGSRPGTERMAPSCCLGNVTDRTQKAWQIIGLCTQETCLLRGRNASLSVFMRDLRVLQVLGLYVALPRKTKCFAWIISAAITRGRGHCVVLLGGILGTAKWNIRVVTMQAQTRIKIVAF